MKRVLMIFCIFLMIITLNNSVNAKENREPFTMKEVVVTGTRYEREIDKVPANITVIREKEIRESGAQSVPELIQFLSGVIVRDLNGNGNNQVVDMGGFGDSADRHVLVLVDGRRVNPIDMSGVRWTTIPIENVERVEILHGAGSVLYGDNAVGGVINIITKTIRGRHEFRGEYGIGNLDTKKGTMQMGFISKGTGIQFGFTQFRTDGYRDRSETERSNFHFKIRHETESVLSIFFEGDVNSVDYQLPGALTETQMNENREQAVNPNDQGKDEDMTSLMGFEADFGENGLLTLTLSRRAENRESDMASWWSFMDFDVTTYGIVSQYVLDKEIFSKENRFTFGVDFYDTDYEASRGAFKGAKTNTYDHSRQLVAGYFQNECTLLPGFILNTGLRYESPKLRLGGNLAGNLVEYRVHEGEWAWNIGASYSFTPDFSAFARIYRAFRYPTVDEYMSLFTGAINQELKQETAIGYEIGAKVLKLKKFRMDMRAFLLNVDDEIAWNNNTNQNENLEETRHMGGEINFNISPLKIMSIYGSLGYLSAKFTKGENDGKKIPLVPKWKGNLGMRLSPWDGLNLRLQYNYVGERYFGNDYANTQKKMDDYGTVDFYLSYKVKKLEFFLNGKNIFNKKYSDYGYYTSWNNTYNYYPMPECIYYGGLRFTF